MNLKDKNIVLCITGGIAAYKAVYLASILRKNGANVYPVMTKNALKFIKPLTLKTITKNKVITNMFDESEFVPHISLSELADLIVVAPATANIIAKASHGIADDMVSTILLSSRAKKIIVPAMNTNMYLNNLTQKNINILKENGFLVIEPDSGNLACGSSGIGRYPETNRIYDFIIKNINNNSGIFKNKKILISLGGTLEDIDPVRYISNKSSGKMGFALAEELINRGGEVALIIGNVSDLELNKFNKKNENIKKIFVRSAMQMKEEILKLKDEFDIYIMTAAVADYTIDFNENKIKKENQELILKLKKTDDIIKSLPKNKKSIYIGFAAETENLLENAGKKLREKQIDILIANEVKGDKSAIGGNNAEVILLNKWNNEIFKIEYNKKTIIVYQIIDRIFELLKEFKNDFFIN